MNFLNLKYFLAVAEEMNITRAAERLYISQQSLSNHIIKLEKELGTPLFVRGPTLELTYAGARLAKAAARILDVERQLYSDIEDIHTNRRGELRLGISHTRGRVIVPELLPLYRNLYPLVEFSLVEGNSAALDEALQHGKIDLVIGFTPILLDTIAYETLLRERLFLVVPRKYMEQQYGPDALEMLGRFRDGQLDIGALRDYPFLMLKKGNRVRSMVDGYLAKNGIEPRILLEIENIETTFALSMRGMGITVYPEMFLKAQRNTVAANTLLPADAFPIPDDDTVGTLVAGYRKDLPLSATTQEFIKLAKTRLPRVFGNTPLPEGPA